MIRNPYKDLAKMSKYFQSTYFFFIGFYKLTNSCKPDYIRDPSKMTKFRFCPSSSFDSKHDESHQSLVQSLDNSLNQTIEQKETEILELELEELLKEEALR